MQRRSTLTAKILFCVFGITVGVLLGAAVILFFWFRGQMEKDYRRLVQTTVENTNETFRYFMDNARDMMTQWFFFPEGTLARLNEDYYMMEHGAQIADIHNTMDNIPYLHSVYILDQTGECSFYTGSAISYTEKLEEILYDKVREQKISQPFLWNVKSRYENEEDIPLISMYFSEPMVEGSDFLGAVIVNLDARVLSKTLFSSRQQDNVELFVLDAAGNVIVHSDNTKCGSNAADQEWVQNVLHGSEQFFSRKDDGRKLEVCWIESSVPGFYVVAQTEVSGIGIINAANRMFLILFCAAMVIMALTVPLCRRIFRPLNEMISRMRAKMLLEMPEDDVQFLSHYYAHLTKDIERLSVQAEKDVIVKNMLLKNSGGEFQKMLLKRKVIDEKKRYFAVLAYLAEQADESRSMQEYETQKELIQGVICSALEQVGVCTYFEVSLKRMLFLVSLEGDREIKGELLQKIMTGAKHSAEELIENKICILISRGADNGMVSCSALYNEMEENLKTRQLIETRPDNLPGDAAITAVGMPQDAAAEYAKLEKLTKDAISAARKGKKDLYLELLHQLLAEACNQKHTELADRLTDLAEKVSRIRIAKENAEKASEVTKEKIREQILQISDYGELVTWFEELYDTTAVQVNQINTHSAASQMEEAVDYIRSHYDDYNLNVNMLALRLNISAAYFGKLFREFAGCSALEYIAKTRMEKAYELLLIEPDKDISQIAAAVGYSNNAYFATAFKKFYGVSPSKLRDYHVAMAEQNV